MEYKVQIEAEDGHDQVFEMMNGYPYIMKVLEVTTGTIYNATYTHNRLGNLRMWVNGKFYSDEMFSKTFLQVDPTENYIKVNGQWQPRKK